jgi:hypothetical protein
MINVNSTDFWNQQNVKSLSYGNGWNYGIKRNRSGSFLLFRFHTNGHQNQLHGKKLFNNCVNEPTNFDEAEILFFNHL